MGDAIGSGDREDDAEGGDDADAAGADDDGLSLAEAEVPAAVPGSAVQAVTASARTRTLIAEKDRNTRRA